MAQNINRVVLTGNLTRDPELRTTPGGLNICKLGLAVNERYKDGASGEWKERASFFDVTVFGAQGEACSRYLSKGRPVAVDGKLRLEQWEARDGGGKRSRVVVIADTVQFLSSGDHSGGGGGGGGGYRMGADSSEGEPANDAGGYHMTDDEFEAAKTAAADVDDDIPF